MTREEWRREVMKAQFVDRRQTMTQLAKDLGISRGRLYQIFNGDATEENEKAWREKINKHLGIKEGEEK